MSLSHHLRHYLNVRRSLGYQLNTSERILRRFVRFADKEGALYIDTALFLRWDASLPDVLASTRATRLRIVRLFAQWLSSADPGHQIPPQGLLPHRSRRSRPHIYSKSEITSIITAAEELPSVYGLRGLTYSTLFGLIAVTGLRISEAVALNHRDFDTDNGIIRVLHGKSGKERLLPLDATVTAQLTRYVAERDRLLGSTPEAFFINSQGVRLTDCNARYNFARLCQQLGLRSHQPFCRHGKGPRIHDLRHTFAVRTMINWYLTDQDPAREMFKLATYLGHSSPDKTFWYLEAVPELLDLALDRATGGCSHD